MTLRLGETVVDSCELEELLGHWASDNTGSSWGRNESDNNRSSLSCGLAGHCVRLTDLVTPISLSDGDDVLLGY